MEIINRLKSPTPTFHKKLRNIALTLAGIAGSIIGATSVAPPEIVFPEVLIQACWYIVVICGAIAGTAQTPVVDGKIIK